MSQDEQEMLDKMTGVRAYVDAELNRLFESGIDLELDEDAPDDAGTFQSVDIVRDSDVEIVADENSDAWF